MRFHKGEIPLASTEVDMQDIRYLQSEKYGASELGELVRINNGRGLRYDLFEGLLFHIHKMNYASAMNRSLATRLLHAIVVMQKDTSVERSMSRQV